MPLAAIRGLSSRAAAWCLMVGCAVGAPSSLVAQVEEPRPPANVEWWHGALFLGGVSTLMLLDNAVKHGAQDLRGSGTDGIS